MRTKSLAALLTLALSLPALAQTESFSAETLRPASDREGILNVESGHVAGHLQYDVALWLGYAHAPFRLSTFDLNTGERIDGTTRDVITGRVFSSLVGQVALFDWVQLGAELPIVLSQGAGETAPGGNLATPAAAGIGDLRLIPKVRVLRAEDQFVDLAVVLGATLPTGAPADGYLGEGGFTFQPELVASRNISHLRVGASLGAKLRGQKLLSTTSFNQELQLGLGAGYRMHETAGIPLTLDLSWAGAAGGGASSHAEAMAGLTYDITDPLQAFAGAGLGLGGVGQSLYRVFLGVRWAPRAPAVKDQDEDGIDDDADRCPQEPEDKDGFQDEDGCVDPDNDGDGVLDADDKCGDEAEDRDGFQDEDGCPDPDNDGDGISDQYDKCPDEAGIVGEQGCPAKDTDKDGILDKDDACPKDPGTPEFKGCADSDEDGLADPDDRCPQDKGALELKGCPDRDADGFADLDDRCPVQPGPGTEDGCPQETKVIITKEKIEILEKVFFDSNKATIKKQSFDILDKVAEVMKNFSFIKKVRIEAHTDLHGNAEYNMDLSNRRAKSVLDYLVKKGIDAGRLESQGFGMSQPAVDSMDKEASAKNRRVEFSIVEQE